MLNLYTNTKLEIQAAPGAFPNLVQNPSGEKGGWFYLLGQTNTSLAPVSSNLQLFTSVAQAVSIYSEHMPIQTGSISVGSRINPMFASNSGVYAAIQLLFYDSNHAPISTSTGTRSQVSTIATHDENGLPVMYYSVAPPAGAAYVQLAILMSGSTGGTVTAGSYMWFQKAMVTTWTSGTWNSLYADPVTWTNILSKATNISIDRGGFGTGSMSAQVMDATLDPSLAGGLKTGRAVRVTVNTPGGYRNLFEGTMRDVKATYSYDGKLITAVSLTATDNYATLANWPQTNGYANIADLALPLQGKGTPFTLNGSTVAASTATTTSTNANASLADQIALTRDNANAFAWVDAQNVLNVTDSTHLVQNTVAAFNGTFETNVTGWTGTNATLARNTAQFHSGTASMSATAVAALPTMQASSTSFAVSANLVKVSAWVKSSTPRQFTIGVSGPNAYNSNYGGQTTVTTTTGWTQVSVVADVRTVPVLSVFLTWMPVSGNLTVGEVHYIDDITVTAINPTFVDTVPTDGQLAYKTDVDAGYDTADIVNSVSVDWLRLSADGSTQTFNYGPFNNGRSIEDNGFHAQTYTLQGGTESASNAQTFANVILAAMSTPVHKVNSLTVPVRSLSDSLLVAVCDLYTAVGVKFSTLVNDTYRIGKVSHSITPQSWLATFEFVPSAALPLPPTMPDMSFNRGTTGTTLAGTVTASSFFTVGDIDWTPIPLNSNFVANGSGTRDPQFRRVAGVVELMGIMKSTAAGATLLTTLPSGARPAQYELCSARTSTGATTTAACRVDIDTSGHVTLMETTAGVGGYVSLNGIRYRADGS